MRAFLLLFTLLFSAGACSDAMTSPQPRELEVEIAPDTFAIDVGVTVAVEVTIDGSQPDAQTTVECSSSSQAVVVVWMDGSCEVTGVVPGPARLLVTAARGAELGSAEGFVLVAQSF